MEIDIRPREMTPGVYMVPSHTCPDSNPTLKLQWFAWTWEAQGLIREWCSEEDLKALRQSPERYITTVLNPKLERCKAKWTIGVSMDDGRVLLKLN
jgi:hypothetical protein